MIKGNQVKPQQNKRTCVARTMYNVRINIYWRKFQTQQTSDVYAQLKKKMSRLFLFGVFLFAIHVMSEMISRVMDKWCFETGQLSTYIITFSKDTLDRFLGI